MSCGHSVDHHHVRQEILNIAAYASKLMVHVKKRISIQVSIKVKTITSNTIDGD